MHEPKSPATESDAPAPNADSVDAPAQRAPEIGGRASGLEPTRYGDWEKDGRCIDF